MCDIGTIRKFLKQVHIRMQSTLKVVKDCETMYIDKLRYISLLKVTDPLSVPLTYKISMI